MVRSQQQVVWLSLNGTNNSKDKTKCLHFHNVSLNAPYSLLHSLANEVFFNSQVFFFVGKQINSNVNKIESQLKLGTILK